MRLHNTINEGKDPSVYEVLQKLYAKSMPFIKEYIKSVKLHPQQYVLWSGRNKNIPYFEERMRTNRPPKDTPESVQMRIDDKFYQKFKVRPRSNGLFTTGAFSTAMRYNKNIYSIWPQGQYKYIWSPMVDDFYADIVLEGEWDVAITFDVDEYVSSWYNRDDLYHTVRYQLGKEWMKIVTDGRGSDVGTKEEYIDEFSPKAIKDLMRQEFDKQIDEWDNKLDRIVSTYKDDDLKAAMESHYEIMVVAKSYMGIDEFYVPYVLEYMRQYGTKKPTKDLVANMDDNDVVISKGIPLV